MRDVAEKHIKRNNLKNKKLFIAKTLYVFMGRMFFYLFQYTYTLKGCFSIVVQFYYTSVRGNKNIIT